MTETYQKLYALIRKLQKIAELETQVENDVDDLRQGNISITDAFFTNYGHDETTLKDLALLCFIKDVDFDSNKPMRSLEDLKTIIEAESFTLSKTMPREKNTSIFGET